MVSSNPFGDFRRQCLEALTESVTKLHPSLSAGPFQLDIPPNPAFGQLASTLPFELGRQLQIKPEKLATQIVKGMQPHDFPLMREATPAGKGYINFHTNFAELSQVTIESAQALPDSYGYVETEEPQTVIVEHTSANPISPIHIGQARNPVLGDSLAHILSARGHTVARHFYVDDVGRQAAVAAYGYEQLDKPTPQIKPDHFIGVIYTLTSCIIEISRLKDALENEAAPTSEAVQKLRRQLDEWVAIAAELENKHPPLFNKLLEKIGGNATTEDAINHLNRAYEAGQESAKTLIREVCQLSLKGIKETLTKVGIFFDSWDWESDFAWNSDVAKTLEALKKTSYVFREGPVLEFDANKVVEDFQLKQALDLREDYELPSLTLVRADGTSLYTTRDIPYTLWKFTRAERVINVVGMEQKLPQLQLKLALWALGHAEQAKRLTHFAHNLVTLPGYRMSSRRGRYISFDDVTNEAVRRARDEVEKRSPHLSDEAKRKIAETVGIGALKYALVEVDPIKPVVFTWDRVINFERNSAPYIQYSYARACSILRKAATAEAPAYAALDKPLEHDLILTLARFPETFIDSAENLKPHAIAEYVNALADKFNSFYNALPVLKAKPKGLSDARIGLVEAISIVLKNSLSLIGIVAPQQM